MSIVPNTDIGKITFYEAHIALWTSHPATIGLSASDCTALSTLIVNARKAYDAQQAAANAAKSATNTMHTSVRLMHALGAADIGRIKAFAEATNNPAVYPAADLPMPATPSPVGPPGTPFDFTVSLMQNGSITLHWKCNNPSGATGTVYEVRRRIGSEGGGSFQYLSTEGAKSFHDDSIPGGSNGVTYEITAVRSTRRGTAAQFNVNFGVGGGGLFIASTSEGSGEMKMAA